MRYTFLASILFVIFSAACVDPIDYALGDDDPPGIVIDGHISDQPGPYTVRISRPFDIQSKLSFRSPVSARQVTLLDNMGNREILTETELGTFQTSSTGIRGVIGRVYRLEVELKDGRVYESIPDTLMETGQVDSIYYEFERVNLDSVARPFVNLFFNASPLSSTNNRFLWKMATTFKVDTNPELYDTICADGRCPKPLPCSGYRLDREGDEIQLVGPCECCTCWATLFNTQPITNNNLVLREGSYREIRAGHIPINQWTFMYKLHVSIEQLSLSQQAFAFWSGVSTQQAAVTSLFQPILGRIPRNFLQKSGKEAAVYGIFYASSRTSKSILIDRTDLPKFFEVPPVDPIINNSCLRAFANSTTAKPDFWSD